MPAATNKTQLLTASLPQLRKRFDVPPESPPRAVLEEVLYAILREGTTSDKADGGFARLKDAFFDWNEVRVSSIPEVADALAGLPDAGAKAQRLVRVLQEVFDERYSFDLSDIAKKGVKQAGKQLARYKGGATDFVVAWVTQRALGGHAIPLDGPTLRALHRLGVVDDPAPEDPEAARAGVEHHVPKAKGHEFVELFARLADAVCVAGTPDCPHCPLKADCPTGQELLAKKPVEPKSKPKPR